MPSLGADMEAGKLVEWLVQPGDKVRRGDVVAVVETGKGAVGIEIFEEGVVRSLEAKLGAELPVGAPLAVILGDAEAEAEAEPADVEPAPEPEEPPAPGPSAADASVAPEAPAPPPVTLPAGASPHLRGASTRPRAGYRSLHAQGKRPGWRDRPVGRRRHRAGRPA